MSARDGPHIPNDKYLVTQQDSRNAPPSEMYLIFADVNFVKSREKTSVPQRTHTLPNYEIHLWRRSYKRNGGAQHSVRFVRKQKQKS